MVFIQNKWRRNLKLVWKTAVEMDTVPEMCPRGQVLSLKDPPGQMPWPWTQVLGVLALVINIMTLALALTYSLTAAHGQLRAVVTSMLTDPRLWSKLHPRVTTLFQQWFSMTFPWLFHDQKNEFPWPIGTTYFFEINNTRFMNAYQNKKITETNILMHFYKKNSWITSLFSMTFHNLGCFPWLSRPGKWSY